MPEYTTPQNPSTPQNTDPTNKMIIRIGIIVGVIFALAILSIIVVMVIVTIDPVGRKMEVEKKQESTQSAKPQLNSTKLSYTVPQVEGYFNEIAPSSSDRDLYVYDPDTKELKKLVSNVNLVVYRSEDPKTDAKNEIELTTKNQKMISINGTDGAYSGCAAEVTEEGYKFKYDYEACAISFYKGDLVVLVEVRAALDIRNSSNKVIGDQLLAEVRKITEAVLATME